MKKAEQADQIDQDAAGLLLPEELRDSSQRKAKMMEAKAKPERTHQFLRKK